MPDHAALVARWWEVWADGDLDTLDDILAEKLVRHSARGTVTRSRAQAKEDMVQYRESVEIANVRVDEQTVAGNNVWSRLTTTGVNLRTEEPSTISWLQVCRIEDGRIAEMWMLYALGIDWARAGPAPRRQNGSSSRIT